MTRRHVDPSLTVTTLRHDRVALPSVEVVAFVEGREVGARRLALDAIVVGSSEDSDLRIECDGVSRKHCTVALTESGAVVRDLGSKNGTAISGVSIAEAYVPAGGRIEIGAATLVLRQVGAPVEVPLWTGGRFGAALGGSVVMRGLFAQLDRAAKAPCSILLQGESGTGKEVLAHAIHEASPRRDAPFVVFDAGATTPELVASELFGHIRGSFTGANADREGAFAQADGGTLFLDEIGELPLALQPLLLRALEAGTITPVGANASRSVDVRVVAATNRDLAVEVRRGRFREDLYYRLAVVIGRVPPLRERKDDIELLVERLLATQSPPKTLLHLPTNAVALLRAYDWPGNVRELRNVVQRMLLFPQGPADQLPVARESAALRGGESRDLDEVHALSWKEAREQVLERFEASYVALKLQECEGNVSRAAAVMGVSRQFLHRLIDRYNLKGARVTRE